MSLVDRRIDRSDCVATGRGVTSVGASWTERCRPAPTSGPTARSKVNDHRRCRHRHSNRHGELPCTERRHPPSTEEVQCEPLLSSPLCWAVRPCWSASSPHPPTPPPQPPPRGTQLIRPVPRRPSPAPRRRHVQPERLQLVRLRRHRLRLHVRVGQLGRAEGHVQLHATTCTHRGSASTATAAARSSRPAWPPTARPDHRPTRRGTRCTRPTRCTTATPSAAVTRSPPA